MNRKALQELVEMDIKCVAAQKFFVASRQGNPRHLPARQQQRVISSEMILVALAYGVRERTHKDLSFTLTDRSLRHTKFFPFIERLRGLRVVCLQRNPSPIIRTVHWDFKVKSKVRC